MLFLFLAHISQAMVRKDQKARSMIHMLGPRSSMNSENASRNTTDPLEGVTERATKMNIEPSEVAMLRGVVDD